MINSISSWAGGIVIAVIIGTILEMILPEGKNKKYIKTVISVYILFTIISPIITKFTGEELSLQKIIEEQNIMKDTKTVQTATIDTNSSIASVYKLNLKNDIKSKLQEKEYKVNKIEFEVELEKENEYGKIYSMNINVEKSSNKSINKVQEVNISINSTKDNETQDITANEKEELKEYLSNTYNVKKEKISIN